MNFNLSMFLKRNTSLHIILPYDSNGDLLKSYINIMWLIITSRACFCAYLIIFHYPIIYKFLLDCGMLGGNLRSNYL